MRRLGVATGITNEDAVAVRVGIVRHDDTRIEILRGEAASSSSCCCCSCCSSTCATLHVKQTLPIPMPTNLD